MPNQLKQSEAELEANFNAVQQDLLPAKMRDGENLDAIIHWLKNSALRDGVIDGSQHNIRRAIDSLAAAGAISWEIAPVTAATAPTYAYPETPSFMDFVKTKQDIGVITRDGRFSRWMKSRHRDFINSRVNFILQNNIE